MNYWVVIPAAGKGARLGGNCPKQYWTVGGKTLLEYTLALFLDDCRFTKIVVVFSKDDRFFDHSPLKAHPKIRPLLGGATRMQSVGKALAYLETVAAPQEWVLVHDAARPCLDKRDLNRFLDTLSQEEKGGILATRMTDTLKKIKEGFQVETTLPREEYVCALTPQMFRLHLLRNAFAQAERAQRDFSDEASLLEWQGHYPTVLLAQYANPKLTEPKDWLLIQTLLGEVASR